MGNLCSRCEGTGLLPVFKRLPDGDYEYMGEGYCPSCNGYGVTPRHSHLEEIHTQHQPRASIFRGAEYVVRDGVIQYRQTGG